MRVMRYLFRRIRRHWMMLALMLVILYILMDLGWRVSRLPYGTDYDDDVDDDDGAVVDLYDLMDELAHDAANVTWRSDDTTCFRPPMEAMPSAFKKYYQPLKPINCGRIRDWLTASNGEVIISDHVYAMNVSFNCYVTPILRVTDYKTNVNLSNAVQFIKPIKAPGDFMVAECNSPNGKSSHTYLATTVMRDELTAARTFPDGSLKMNVLMLGFDSVSRLSWLRTLPKSANYFDSVMGGVVLEGYNILGDGTTQALLPLLVGMAEPDLPYEVRRGYAEAKELDDLPWLWTAFARKNYVTQWGEDGSEYGTFQYRLVGFKDPPVHHYMRPFYLFAEQHLGQHPPNCFGGKLRFKTQLNYVKDLYSVYEHRPKFSFMFHSELSHDSVQTLQHADLPLLNFLKEMHESGKLDNTMLILMSDHGMRFQEVRETIQGKFEERLPYFGIWLPPSVQKKYPVVWQNLLSNRKKLTTAFDVHDTLANILNFKYDVHGPKPVRSKRGISLFQSLPENRTCAEAGVEPHWCTCLRWHKLNPASDPIQAVGWQVIHKINELTHLQRSQCEELRIVKVLRAEVYVPESMLLRFRGSRDLDGRLPDFTDLMATEVTFRVTVRTAPNDGLYEATVTNLIKEDTYRINEHQISRINAYGKQPQCIADRSPHLRPFCYCTPS